MAGVFICYRRDDSSGYAGRLQELLAQELGAERVYMDLCNLDPGADFILAIENTIGSADVLLALIGRHWLEQQDTAGNRRLDDPEDLVRLEIATAFRHGVRILPLLLEGATMPAADALPPDLVPLSRIQALTLSNGHWKDERRRLLEAVKPARFSRFRSGLRRGSLSLGLRPVPLLAGFVLLFAAVAAFWSSLPEAGLPWRRRPSLAVLPLLDLSTDKLASAPLPDSRLMSGMLIDLLGQQSRIRILPYTETSQMAQHLPVPLRGDCLRREILERIHGFMGADFVLGGSFERAPGTPRLRLNLCLQRASDGSRRALLDPDFRGDRPLTDFAAEVARDVLGKISFLAVLSLADQPRLSTSDTAVASYFKGLGELDQYHIPQAVSSLCQARKIDPGFYHAHFALSKAWREIGYDGKAVAEAERAGSGFRGSWWRQDRERIEAYGHAMRRDWDKAIEMYRMIWARSTDSFDDAIELIEVQNLAGKRDQALATIDQVRALEKRREIFVSDRNRVRLQIQEAIARIDNDPREQLRLAHAAAEAAYGLQEDALEARARFFECDALIRLKPQRLGDTCTAAERKFRSLHDPVNEAKVLQVEGNYHLEITKDIQMAFRLYEQALQTFNAAGFQRGIVDALTNLSYALSELQQPRRASEVCERALRLAASIQSLNRPAIANQCGYLRAERGEIDSAITLYQEAIAEAPIQGNRRIEAVALGNLAYMYHIQKKFPEALRLYDQSIDISQAMGDVGFDETRFHRARLLADMGRLSPARAELGKALAAYSGKEKAEVTAEFLCDMNRYLDDGGDAWRRIAAELPPVTCDEKSEPPPRAEFQLPAIPVAELIDC
ncbi:MAG TPA: tetratricopeptide repeat protein [Thermoanaerobaculia bacterium]|nr:tetratricopeptide repeat protein [Thermoanaerobaculia bacterium]